VKKPLLLAALAAVALPLAAPSPAQADVRVRVGGGVRVRVGGHARVRIPVIRVHRPRMTPWARPRLRVAGTIYVGGGVYYDDGFAPPPPPPAPACDCEGPPAYYPPVTTAPIVAAVAPEPELPRLGIGVAAGSVDTKDGVSGSDLALIARLRLSRNGGLELEGELGKSELEDSSRVDRRLGGSLIWNLSPRSTWNLYLLGGLGVTQVDVGDDWSTDQSYGELGIGLRLKVTPRFHIAGDVRAGSRSQVDDEMPTVLNRQIAPPADDTEDYTRARLSAMVYF
jgi:hypothetical protein